LNQAAESPVGAAPLPPDAEYLLTDGRGGYLLQCVDDLPRRRYHGFWITRLPDAAKRTMVVAHLHEQVAGKDQPQDGAVSLLHAHWAGLPAPSAPMAAAECVAHRPPTRRCRGRLADGRPFDLDRTAVLLRADGAREPALLVRWHNRGAVPLRLFVRPLLGLHDVDHLPPARDGLAEAVQTAGASWGFRPVAELPTLWLSVGGVAAFTAEPTHYRGFLYATDRDRGYDHLGDRWSPGQLDLLVPAGGTATIAFAFEAAVEDPDAAFAVASAELAERSAAAVAAHPHEPARQRLWRGADAFSYRARGERLGVLAGFPWFGEWGRDVFLALPGLTLARGDLSTCAAVLRGALPFLRGGLLPNIYGRDVVDSHYGSCDAALWFALAVQRYADAGGDRWLLRDELVPALAAIADAYLAGTELGLSVDAAGLLDAGGPDRNATWMDAQTRHGPVTPRQGQPVEIQALWYALLAFLVEAGESSFAVRRDRAGASFLARFWLADGEYLADRWCEGAPDRTVRPNMVLAAALPRSPLGRHQRAGVVRKATADLVTPRGLRTLAPHDPRYEPRYGGGPEARDFAYHQGTVWPWLVGSHVEAALAAASPAELPATAAALRAWLDGILVELDRAGLDHVSEVFDGTAVGQGELQRPGGTIAQAWNTGELLRALVLLDAVVASPPPAALAGSSAAAAPAPPAKAPRRRRSSRPAPGDPT
jgi:predicted glycogen debranching enzyme